MTGPGLVDGPSTSSGRGKPTLALLAVTAIWGSTFFLIKDVVTRIPAADLLAVRFALASVGLAVLLGRRLAVPRSLLVRGSALGLLYGAAQVLQTLGLAKTAASVSGFLTGLYVVATPLLGAAILRQRIRGTTWAAVALATVGLAVLSLTGVSTGYGELLTVASAVVYAGHILALGRISTPGTALGLSLVQLVVISLACTLLAVLPVSGTGLQLPATGADWLAVAYLGLVAGAVTMVAQTWAQARMDATRAAVIMAMEPVWAAAFAVALGGEVVTVRLLVGGLAILAAIYLAELPGSRPPATER